MAGDALAFVRRNPATIAAAAVALGFAIARASRRRARRGDLALRAMNTGRPRRYDPDEQLRSTPHGDSGTRRDLPIRA